jgi:fluoride exporter
VTSPADPRPELPVDPDSPSPPLHLRPSAAAWVAAGGVIGTAARYAVALALPTPAASWPWATFVVNLVGAFVLGVLLEALAQSGADSGWRRRLRLLIGTGFCGSLTTYSTFAVEVDLLLHHSAGPIAAGYLAASLVGGIAVTAGGIAVAARWTTP